MLDNFLPAGQVGTLVGSDVNWLFQDGFGTNAGLISPMGVLCLPNGNVLVADYLNSRIRHLECRLLFIICITCLVHQSNAIVAIYSCQSHVGVAATTTAAHVYPALLVKLSFLWPILVAVNLSIMSIVPQVSTSPVMPAECTMPAALGTIPCWAPVLALRVLR